MGMMAIWTGVTCCMQSRGVRRMIKSFVIFVIYHVLALQSAPDAVRAPCCEQTTCAGSYQVIAIDRFISFHTESRLFLFLKMTFTAGSTGAPSGAQHFADLTF